MNDVYKSPESNLEVDKYQSLVIKLLKEQSIILALLSAVFGTVAMLVALSLAPGIVPLFVFVLPGLVSGILIKLLGRPIKLVYRFVPSLICGVIVLVWFSLDGVTIHTVLLPFLNILACLAISRRNLNYEEEKAIYKYKHGLIKL